jgi:FkbM family methyltransferase
MQFLPTMVTWKVLLYKLVKILTKPKKAFDSRRLFNNWLELLIKYALKRIGFDAMLIARVNECALELSPEVFGKIVNRFSHGFIKSIECINHKLFVNGIEVNSINDVVYDLETYARVLGWTYDAVHGFWYKDNIKFRYMRTPILEIFEEGMYEMVDVKGKIVVDVGAYISDSAIDFALKGAKRVFAIEPHPDAFAEMLDNIKLNNLEHIIVPLNLGIASRLSKICIENADIRSTAQIYHRPGNCIDAVPAITLGELINKFNIEVNDAVLKMDCEGCEFDVILNDYEHVRLFRELVIEYHPTLVNKSLKDMLKVLGIDYRCNIRGDERFGIMYCVK